MRELVIAIVVVAAATTGDPDADSRWALEAPAAGAVEGSEIQSLALRAISFGADVTTPPTQVTAARRVVRSASLESAPNGRWLSAHTAWPIAAIASHVTIGEVEYWIQKAVAGTRQTANKNLSTRRIVETALARAYNELLRFSPVAANGSTPLDPQSVLSASPDWLLARRAMVESPFRYLLGYQVALGSDVIWFLDRLSCDGKIADKNRRIIAVLTDDNGEAYPHLVAEYVLHEYLERNGLSHHEAIALTTRLFEYGIYRGAERTVHADPSPNDRLYKRPGQTPLGQALRLFISWRFESRVAAFPGRQAYLTVLDLPERRLLSLEGRILDLVSLSEGQPAIRVALGTSEAVIGLRRIVRIRPDFAPRRTFDRDDVSFDEVTDRLDWGESVTLSEPQVRTLALASESKRATLFGILTMVRAARDALAVGLDDSAEPVDTADLFYGWGSALSAALQPTGFCCFSTTTFSSTPIMAPRRSTTCLRQSNPSDGPSIASILAKPC